MIDHLEYRELLKEQGIEDINEILSRNNYHSLKESNPKNDPTPLQSERNSWSIS